MLNAGGYFVTGIDTDVGKTWSTLALMRALQLRNQTVAGMKPVAAGCDWLDGGWRNNDALLLQQSSSLRFDYQLLNPYAFRVAASPHVACGETRVDLAVIRQGYQSIQAQVDVVLIEGAGGWFSPLDLNLLNCDLASELGLPVIMVVGMRLGCLNHALLTVRAIRESGLPCVGWLAVNLQSRMLAVEDNVLFLERRLEMPLLGVLPYLERLDVDTLARVVKV